jgi:hypothetical protein
VSTDLEFLSAPEAGGRPAWLAHVASEAIRAANHATINRQPVPGLTAAADVYDTVAALAELAYRLPQLCEQLADLLTIAAQQGTLTGPAEAPASTAGDLREAAGIASTAAVVLDLAHQTLGGVGGWLGSDAAALAGAEED